MWTIVLGGLGGPTVSTARADEALDRALLRDRELSLSPPALVRGDNLFIPLNLVIHGLGISATPQPGGREWQLSFFEKRIRFTLGQPRATGPAGEITLDAPAFQEAYGVYVPAQLLRSAFGLVMERGQDAQGLSVLRMYTSGVRITAARAGSHPDRERVVLDLDAESLFDWQCTGDQVELYLARPPSAPLPARQVSLEGFNLKVVCEVSRTVSPEGFALVEINLKEDSTPEVFTLSNPARIVIDIPLSQEVSGPRPTPASPPAPPPREGRPTWKVLQFPMQLGVMNAYVMRFPQSDARWTLRPVLAGDTIRRRRTVLSMVRQVGGVAGLNAGYFAWEGPPVGTVVIDGEWICTPVKPFRRTCLAISKDGKLSMGRWRFNGHAYFGEHGYLRINAINRSHYAGDELIMFTRRYATALKGNVIYTRLVIDEGDVVTLKESSGREVQIPEKGCVLSGRGKYAELLKKIEVGESVRLDLGTDPPLPDLWSLLEGGPRCMVDGGVCNYADVERFRDDVRYGRGSRSGIGITKSGEILLVAVESPGTGRGGLYLDEMAAIMKKLGAYQAMNWDGGGSTTVVVGDRIINRVAADPRPVSTALVVVPRR